MTSKEGHEGAVERERFVGKQWGLIARDSVALHPAIEEEQKAARYAELKRQHQIEACLRGEHEAVEGLGVTHRTRALTVPEGIEYETVTHEVCRHCRCAFVPR